MIKTVLRVVMTLAIIYVAYLCYASIQKPIEFDNQAEARKAKVIERLIAIRSAEVEYKDAKGVYTASFDTLIDFLKNEQKAQVKKEGRITDQQLAKGLTEKKALDIIKNNDSEAAAKYGIEDFEAFKNEFKRDTIYGSVLDALNTLSMERTGKPFPPVDSLKYVPCTNGKLFELETGSFVNKSEVTMSLFEARVLNDVYLNGLERQYIVNLNKDAEQLMKYPGLKVGDKEAPNNNAGNWE